MSFMAMLNHVANKESIGFVELSKTLKKNWKMTEKQRLKEAEALLRSLKTDAKLALSGKWDKGDEGFQAQIDSIDKYFKKVNSRETPASKFKQSKINF
jgi:hypothetical protein